MTVRRVLLVFVLAVLSGCTTISKVGPGQISVKDLTLHVEGPWNRFESSALVLYHAPGATEIWTREGFTLDQLAFYAGIGEGETMGSALPQNRTKLPAFHASMTPHEIVELYETLVTQDGSAFKARKLEPAAFAGGDGFRFEFELRRKGDSLALQGVGYGAILGKRLYLMTFTAPQTYFYPKLAPEVEALARSARLKR
jgi:hypothetical protein